MSALTLSPIATRLAVVLMWIFAIQSVVRLVLLGPVFGLGYGSSAVHSVTLLVFAILSSAAFAAAKGKNLAQFALSALISVFLLWLTVFDVNAFAALRVGWRPLRADTIAWLYCNMSPWQKCLTRYPDLFGFFGLAFAGLTIALFLSSNKLAVRLRPVWKFWRKQRAGDRISAGRIAMFSVLAGYAFVWVLFPNYMLAREPAFYLSMPSDFAMGPAELTRAKRVTVFPPSSEGVQPKTLILITADSLRFDAVGLDPRYPTNTPFLRSLAIAGKLQDLGPATSICGYSYCGIIGMLSSSSWASLESESPLMLQDVLRANGYQNVFLLSGPHLSVLNMKELYGPNISILLDDSSADSLSVADDRDQIQRLSNLQVNYPKKTFINVHLMSSHAAGQRFLRPKKSILDGGHYLRSDDRKRYLAGVRQVDWVIGKLFSVLREKGLLEDAIIVITSDHGERFDHNGLTHGGSLDEATTQIPLLVYQSDRTRMPARLLVSQTDVAPTLLDAAGIDIPAAWTGNSLFQNPARVAVPTDSARTAGMVAVVDGRKLLFRCDIKSGNITVSDLAGRSLPASKRREAVQSASALFANLEERRNAKRCHA